MDATPERYGGRIVPALDPTPVDVYALRRREAVYRWAADAFVREGRGRVVDLWCGDGYGTAILAASGLDVVGLAPDDATARRAARAYRFGHIEFRADDLPATTEPQHTADAVVCAGLLERLDDPRPLLAEMQRLLRPGGVVVVATPNRLTASPGRTRPLRGEHAWEYTPDEFQHLMAHGFPDVRPSGVFHGRRLHRLERVLGTSLARTMHRTPPADRAGWLRVALHNLSHRAFEIRPGSTRTALDLVAVARA